MAYARSVHQKSRIRKIVDYTALTCALTLLGLVVMFVGYNLTAGNL